MAALTPSAKTTLIDCWYRMEIEQVKVEPERFPNDSATNLAALDIYLHAGYLFGPLLCGHRGSCI
jgi:hypothetical protein